MTESTRILIVEDEILIAHQLASKLKRLGYEVVGIAAYGEDAIREAATKQPDLVLMDIVIKGDMDGIEAAAVIQRNHGIPVIYLTAYADDATIAQAEKTGAYGYVVKPFQEREVHAMIRLALNRHGRAREIAQRVKTAERLAEGLRQTLGEVALQVGGLGQGSLSDDLRQAIARNEFEIHYLPRVALSTGEICGVEALLRWRHPRMGLLLPGRFLPLAEEDGLIAALDEWVLKTACAQARIWRARWPSVRLSVNVSGANLRRDRAAAWLEKILHEADLEPSGLEVDLAETILFDHSEQDMAAARALKSLGVGLALDDFGSGCAAIARLERFPLDAVKIDPSFVHRAGRGVNAEAVVQAVLQLADTMGLVTVAEAVETQAELDLLREHGCDDMQGFLFSPPLPAVELERLLADGKRLDPPHADPKAAQRSAQAGERVQSLTDPIRPEQQELVEQLVEQRTRQLREMNVELEAFVRSVSHDLRTPLRAIIGFASILGQTAHEKLDEEEHRILQRVLHAGRDMAARIEGLLRLSRLSRHDLQIGTVDLSAMVAEVVEHLRSAYPSRPISISVSPGLVARADPRLLRIVVENLLENAIKFARADAAPVVSVTRADTPLGKAFCVSDNGIGFDMAWAGKLFGVFERLHPDREGNGIGLASVKRIIARHGGQVWAESVPGEGARFWFSLPERYDAGSFDG